jgi:carbon monoxide dehydrogenase subunit G
VALLMNGSVELPAPRISVWAELNDPNRLKICIPGCEELKKISDNEFRATAKMRVGPVTARFKGRVTLSDFDAPNSYKISGEGEGGIAGFAKGNAMVRLEEKGSGTLLIYNVDVQIGGKLAQLGQRLISGTARKLTDEFFAKFAEGLRETA